MRGTKDGQEACTAEEAGVEVAIPESSSGSQVLGLGGCINERANTGLD